MNPLRFLLTGLLLLSCSATAALQSVGFVPYNTTNQHTVDGIIYANGTFTGNGSGLAGIRQLGVSSNNPVIRLVVIGDSLSVGTRWPGYLTSRNPGVVILTNLAASGADWHSGFASLAGLSNQVTAAMAFAPTNTGIPAVASLRAGINDIAADTAEHIWSNTIFSAAALKSAGFDVMLWTITDNVYNPFGSNFLKTEAINSQIRQSATNWFRLCDAALLMGNPWTTNAIVDGTHPTPEASAVEAGYVSWLLTHGDGYVPTLADRSSVRVHMAGGYGTNLTLLGTTTVQTNLFVNGTAGIGIAGSEAIGLSVNLPSDKGSTLLSMASSNVTKFAFTSNGRMTASYLANSTSANAEVELTANGPKVKRNVADTQPALFVDLMHASSTANIAEFNWQSSAKAYITRQGSLNASGTATASNFVATASASATPAFKSSVTNNFILKADDGGTWILRVGNDGTLTTVTNTSGL